MAQERVRFSSAAKSTERFREKHRRVRCRVHAKRNCPFANSRVFEMYRLMVVAVALCATSSFAWIKQTTAKVGDIQLGSGQGSFNFTLEGLPPMCPPPVNANHSNLRGAVNPGSWVENGVTSTMTAEDVRMILSTLTAAKLAGRSVRVYASASEGVGWGCRVQVVDLM